MISRTPGSNQLFESVRRVRSFTRSVSLVAATCLFATTGAQAGTEFTWSPLLEPGVGGQVTALSVSPFDSNRVLAGGDLLGTALSTDGGVSWVDTFGFSGGGHTVEQYTWVDANTVWVGTGRGPYLSTDGGLNWVNKRSGFPSFTRPTGMTAPVQKILVDPNNSSRVLAFIGNFRRFNSRNGYSNLGEVWESLDSGETWALKSTMAAGKHIDNAVYKSSVATDSDTDDDTIYATAGNKFYRSDDDGATWNELGAGITSSPRWVTKSASDNDTVWVISRTEGVFKSTDAGANFAPSSADIPAGSEFRVIEADLIDDGVDVLYATVTVGDPDRGVWRSGDGGATWARTNYTGAPGAAGYPDNAYPNTKPKVLTIDPSNDGGVFMGSNETIYGTNDSGANWFISSAIALGNGFYVGTGYSGLVSEDFFFNPFNPLQSSTAGLDSGKWFSSDDLQTWKFTLGGFGRGNGTFNGQQKVAFTATDGVVYATEGQFGFGTKLLRTLDNGVSWQTRTLPVADTAENIQDLYVHPTETDRVWVIQEEKLFYSTDGGSTWTRLRSGLDKADGTAADILVIGADPVNNPGVIYVGTVLGGYVATDGQNFVDLNFPGDDITEILVDPVKLDRIYVVNRRDSSSRRGVYRYDGDTASWTTVLTETDSPLVSINDVAIDPLDNTRVFISTDQDPFKSNTNETGVWLIEGTRPVVQVNDGLPNLRVQSLTFKPGTSKLVASINGRGYYVTETGNAGGGEPIGIKSSLTSDASDAGYYIVGDSADRGKSGVFKDGGATIVEKTSTSLKVGRPDGSFKTHGNVFPFQLPDLGPRAAPFLEAEFYVNLTDRGNNFANFGVDLYGLGVRDTAVVLPEDGYVGGPTDATDATKLQDNFLRWPNNSSRPSLGIKRTSAVGVVNLTDYLNAQYAGGANAGKYVFLRLNPDRTPKFSFKFGRFSASETGNADNRPTLRLITVDPVLAADDFNGTDAGALPDGWSSDVNNGSVGVAEFPDASDRSLELSNADWFKKNSATRDFLEPTSDVVTAEFRYRQGLLAFGNSVQLRGEGLIAVDLVTLAGTLYAISSTSVTPLQAVAPDTWYDIKIVADPVAGTFDVSIDNVQVGTGIGFLESPTELDQFFVTTGIFNGAVIYIDDLLVTR